MRIEYLADHEAYLPTIASWQHSQFGYLNPCRKPSSKEPKGFGRLSNETACRLRFWLSLKKECH